MPAPLNVDKEALRVLVVAVGAREAARRMNIPENTVLSYSKRGNWLTQPEAKPLPPTVKRTAISAIKPAEAMANVLTARKNRTRVNLSKYLVNASQVASRSRKPLEDAPLVDKVANVMTKLWPEQREQPSGPLNLNLLGGRAVIQINQQPKNEQG